MKQALETALASYGMILRGGFTLDAAGAAAEGLDADVRAVLLIGNAGPAMGEIFRLRRLDGPDPLDRWTGEVLTPLAEAFEAEVLYPFEGPPYYPFIRWAQRAEAVHPSPVGMLIHPDHGLWHAYRAAFLFRREVDLPEKDDRPSPCETCVEKPCLTTCPVSAFRPEGYRVEDCREHLRTDAGTDCMEEGCRARRACPVGRGSYWGAEMAAFHMRAFRR
ncbi:MAG: ferredoxin [Alphaproteobacteria bacterium]|nr:ferredoxin [Alphaproteobacteria bacterium]